MVKKWICVFFVLAFLIFCCVFESVYTGNAFDYLEHGLTAIAEEITKDEEHINTQKNMQMVQHLHENWHKKLDVLRCLIWHSSNKDVEIGLTRILWYIEENNYTEAIVEINSLYHYSQHYSEDFKISLPNIL